MLNPLLLFLDGLLPIIVSKVSLRQSTIAGTLFPPISIIAPYSALLSNPPPIPPYIRLRKSANQNVYHWHRGVMLHAIPPYPLPHRFLLFTNLVYVHYFSLRLFIAEAIPAEALKRNTSAISSFIASSIPDVTI